MQSAYECQNCRLISYAYIGSRNQFSSLPSSGSKTPSFKRNQHTKLPAQTSYVNLVPLPNGIISYLGNTLHRIYVTSDMSVESNIVEYIYGALSQTFGNRAGRAQTKDSYVPMQNR